MSVSIVLADDHPMTRAGISFWLSRQEGFRLLDEAQNGVEAWEKIERHAPDVALLDIEMPGESGIIVAQKIKDSGLATSVLMLTSYKAQPYVMASLRAGALGFILKTAPLGELETAIKTVNNGNFYIDPDIAHFSTYKNETLTQREREVFILTAQGLSGKDCASSLGIGERTVETHLGAAYGKLGARNKTEAILIALKNGVIFLEEL